MKKNVIIIALSLFVSTMGAVSYASIDVNGNAIEINDGGGKDKKKDKKSCAGESKEGEAKSCSGKKKACCAAKQSSGN